MRSAGPYLDEHRMYETLAAWETDPTLAGHSALTNEYARVWQAADKIVHSTTLEASLTQRTTIERSFDPEVVRELKAAAPKDLLVGGPTIAVQAFAAESPAQ
jgi:hypothetical protein